MHLITVILVSVLWLIPFPSDCQRVNAQKDAPQQRNELSYDSALFQGRLFTQHETPDALEFIWRQSFQEKISRKGKRTLLPVREVAAWITPEGILVQPWSGPLYDEAGNVITPWAVNYCNSFTGVSYHNFLPVRTGTCAVFFEGRWLKILGEIHTHPVTGGLLRDEDQQAEREFGIPVYCLERGVIKDAHGHAVATMHDPAGFLSLFFGQDQLLAQRPAQ